MAALLFPDADPSLAGGARLDVFGGSVQTALKN
jgi:hypothetical protein